MLLLSNVQMNTDFGTLHNRDAERSTCKVSTLVFCWGPATKTSDTRVSRTTDVFRKVPIWKILSICCPDKKHSKGRRLDSIKRRKGWRCSYLQVWKCHDCSCYFFFPSSNSESHVALESQLSNKKSNLFCSS